jgi:flagellar basal body-associated protein FliL
VYHIRFLHDKGENKTIIIIIIIIVIIIIVIIIIIIIIVVTCTPEERRYLGTARQAAEEEGVTRKRLAIKQCQGSVSYGVGPQAIYREPCTSKS